MSADPRFKTASENVIRALARVMAAARAGNVETVAIVAIGPDGMPDVSFGGEAELMPSVNLGLDLLKSEIVGRSGRTAEQPVSPIVRAAN